MKEKKQKQKILFICQNFWPENFRSTDVVNNLIKSGNNVEVLTSNPNYPEGKIYKGYSWFNCKTQKYQNKFNIHRVPTIPRGKSNYFLILLNYLGFIFFGIFFGLYKLRYKKFDMILVFASSPIFQVLVGYAFKLSKKIKLATWVQDLWPENLQALKIINNKFVLNIISFFTTFTYNLNDVLIAQSISFQKILKRRTSKRVFFVPNYAEDFEKKIKKKKNTKRFIIIYAGNIGKAQKLITLLKAAKKLTKNKRLFIKIFGDGVELNYLKEYQIKNNVTNVKFYGKVSKNQIYTEYQNAHALYLSLAKNKFLNYTIPAKLQTYFSIKKVIIASGGGEMQKIINSAKVGYCSKPEDVNSLYKNIKKILLCKKAKLKNFESSSKSFFNKNFANEIINNKLNDIINYKI
ncbi:glycosyltransferase family 4 protein [Candidatus Pelagibacter sp.]|nr:glycosyltransferase family 4 protein [Candidatus Pelagibacter sp.]